MRTFRVGYQYGNEIWSYLIRRIGRKGAAFFYGYSSQHCRTSSYHILSKFVQSWLLVLYVLGEHSDRICGEQGVPDVSNTYQLLKMTALRSVEASGYVNITSYTAQFFQMARILKFYVLPVRVVVCDSTDMQHICIVWQFCCCLYPDSTGK